ncbi:MAG: hypothetical protein ACP5NY_07280 [Thermocladium sp.]
MDARIISRIIKVSLKERYTRGGLLVVILVIGFSMFFLSLSYLIGLSHLRGINVELPREYVLYISVFLVFYLFPSISMFSKAEADFVLTAPIDPTDIMIAKIMVAAITDVSIILAMTYWYPMIEAITGQVYILAEYLVEAIAIGLILSIASLLLGLRGGRAMIMTLITYASYAVATSLMYPQLNIVYMVMKPNLYYLALILAALLFTAALLKRSMKSIYVNIYSLSINNAFRGIRRRSEGKPFSSSISFAGLGPLRAMLKSSLLSASLQLRMNAGASSTYRLQRVNALMLGLPISAVSAIIYTIIVMHLGYAQLRNGFILWFPEFYIGIFAFSIALSGLSGERLWLSCMAMDCTGYFRLRMLTRSIVGLILASPWAVAYLAIYLVTGSPLALLLIVSMLSMMPTTASISLIIGPWTGIRQNRFIGLEEYVPRVNVLGFLIGIVAMLVAGAYLIPSLIYMASPSLGTIAAVASIMLLVISMAIPRLMSGRAIMRRFLDKLIEEGFI